MALSEDNLDLDPDSIEVARITVVKTLCTESGGVEIYTSYSDGLVLSDALGMLAFSQATTVRTYLEDAE